MAIRIADNSSSGAKIRVVGVGGGGGNALNSMVNKGIEGVEFVAINTDAQVLEKNKAETKIQIGRSLTKGLGAGMVEEVGYKAVEESREEIESALKGSDMVFVTAGMGGGTGTGGAPAVARIAKSLGALVVTIVTKPFRFEGKHKLELAMRGIEKLKNEVDSLIVIPNENILGLVSKEATNKQAFELADRVLYNAVNGISKIITETGEINVDFADVKTIMKDMGDAMIGTGIASGKDRAEKAAEDALLNPLLDEIKITGSKCVLTNICANGLKVGEIETINEIIQKAAGEDAKYIMGWVEDENMQEEIMVTIIATGFNKKAVHVKTQIEQSEISFIDNTPEGNYKGYSNSKGRISTMPSHEELRRFDEPAYTRRQVELTDDLSEKKKKIMQDPDDDFDFNEINQNDDFEKPAFLRRSAD
ncbi:MAG TPA: cell division protein FtsZ [Ignavibacteria bacterium]|nr:cell division protein FtsZ [Bacteroidota bacterium]HRI84583.1 cell division protein FtsZ [Ignavibacteria bacterium]HRJ98902.1 cell division protein FtsZ [Ignavibacteria bacterium]